MSRILLVDEHHEIIDTITRYLKKEGLEVIVARNGIDALHLFKETEVELVLTDILLPKLDGYELMEAILQLDEQIPFVFMSDQQHEQDKIYSLMLGADDFITKPFNPRELALRIKNIVRRTNYYQNKNLKSCCIGALSIDNNRHSAYLNNTELPLSNKEFELLQLFALNIGRVFSKSELYEKIWRTDFFEDANTLNVHIHGIREKMNAVNNPGLYPKIQTVWGLGYRMEIPDGLN
ncbi:response regulator transcription factor [Enterococcus sp. LJL90]